MKLYNYSTVIIGSGISGLYTALKISENSAKVIFFRAKKMLLEELKNDYYM